MLTNYNRNTNQLPGYQPDLAEKIADFGLGLLRIGFGKTVTIKKLPPLERINGIRDNDPANYSNDTKIHSIPKKIAAIALFILALPVTGLLAIAGSICWKYSRSTKHIDSFNRDITALKTERLKKPLTAAVPAEQF